MKSETRKKDNYISSDEDINLLDLIFTLLRRWKLIIGVTVIFVMLGLAFALTRPNIYKASSRLMISSGNIYSVKSLDNSEIMRNQKLVSTYTEIAKSKMVVEKVAKKLDMNENVELLAKRIKVTPIEDTEFINISFKSNDPRVSMIFVNEVSKEFMVRVKEIMNFQNLKIVDSAKIPTKAEPKKRLLILMASMILGVGTGSVVAFLFEFLHSKLRKPDEIEKILCCEIIGNIPSFEVVKGGENDNR